MIEVFLSYCTWRNFIIYTLVHVLTYWYAMNTIKKLITKDKERDTKYAAFSRTDKDRFTWWKFPCTISFN
jgi:hypothetical protein